MATDLTNSAASGGLDFGSILDKTISAWSTVSATRTQNEALRYQTAAQVQLASLNAPQAYGQTGAFSIGNTSLGRMTSANGQAGVGVPLSWVVAGVGLLVGGFILRKVLK